jgi:WD40 repeat protein
VRRECREFDELLVRAGTLSVEDARELDAHLAGCASCRELARSLVPVEAEASPLDDELEDLPRVDPTFYVRESKVGEGGMGVIWRARDRRLGRTVVLKELKATDGRTLRPRFEREARLTARLQHPAIVSIHEAGEWPDGQPFYSMELVRGRPLDEVIAGRATFAERSALLPAVTKVAEAIAYAHGQRVVHRDITPRNVLVGEFGEVVVIDWGLAKDLDDPDDADVAGPYRDGDGLTQIGVGTPSFMSPEQALGAPADEQMDVYALGAVLYHLVAGEPPYGARAGVDVRRRLVDGPPPSIRTLCPSCPAELASLVERAMARNPAERIATARELADELQRFQTGRLLASHRYSLGELVRNWARRHRTALRLAAAVLTVLVVGAAIAIRRVIVERDRAAQSAARLLEEDGRLELLAGQPLRAAAFLAEAYRRGVDSPQLRASLASALRPFEARVRTLTGHADEVLTFLWTPDSARLVTRGDEGDLRVWDVASGRMIALVHDDSPIVEAALDARGTVLATAHRDGSVRLRDLARGIAIARPVSAGVRDQISRLAFSPDGDLLAIASPGAHVQVVRGASGEVVRTFDGAGTRYVDRGVAELQWRGDRIVAQAAEDVLVWDAATGRLLGAAGTNHRPGARVVAVRPDGRQVAHALVDTNAELGSEIDVLGFAFYRPTLLDTQGQSLIAMAYSPDGNMLFAGGSRGRLSIWNTSNGVQAGPLVTFGHDGAIRDLAFSADGRYVATAGIDGRAHVWGAATGDLLAITAERRGPLSAVAFSPDGRWLATAGLDRTVELYDVAVLIDTTPLPHQHDKVTAVAVSPDAALVATGGWEGSVAVWTRAGRHVSTMRGSTPITALAFSPDGNRLASVGWDPVAHVWDARSGRAIATLVGHRDRILAAAWSPDGTELATASEDRSARIWNVAAATSVVLDGHRDAVSAIAFAHDGRTILTASYDGTARLWSTRGESLASTARGDGIRTASFAPDASRFVTGSDDGTAIVWDRAGGKRAVLSGHAGTIWWAGFSPDGTRVLTAGTDGTARVFDAATGAVALVLDDHHDAIVSAAWSPDGAQLATGGHDGKVRLWDAADGMLLALRSASARIQALAFAPDSSFVAFGSFDGAARIWDVHRDTRDRREIAALAEQLPWRVDDTALVPMTVAVEASAARAPIEQDACDAGDSVACARSIANARILDCWPQAAGEAILYIVERRDAPALIHPYGGRDRGGDLYVALIEPARIRPILVTRRSWPVQAGALGEHGGTLLAFANVRRRSNSHANDGHVYRIDLSTRVPERAVLYTEWNSGYVSHFEDGELIHWSFTDDRAVRGKDRAGEPRFVGVAWEDFEKKHRELIVRRLGLPTDTRGSLDELMRQHLARAWGSRWPLDPAK